MSASAQALYTILLVFTQKNVIINQNIVKEDDNIGTFFNPLGMHRVGFSNPKDKELFESQKVNINKYISKYNSEARAKAKLDFCLLCKKQCSSFCNSHSVPQFALRRIAENGKVHLSLQGELPVLGDDLGVNKAGTFRVICNKCDSDSFQDYEDPKAYQTTPTDKILSQIALKNHLHEISKRLEEVEIYKLLSSQAPNLKDFFQSQENISQLDLNEFYDELNYAKKAILSKFNKNYHLCFFKVLDYVVPFSTQDEFALVSDFNDCIINNIYNTVPNYVIKYIHIAVFPLETTTVVMLFIKEGEKRYRDFYKQLNKLPLSEQLSAINYIIFSYTENVYLSPSIHNQLKNNRNYMDVCRKTTIFESIFPISTNDGLSLATKEFSLSQRNKIPNLLSQEYSIK